METWREDHDQTQQFAAPLIGQWEAPTIVRFALIQTTCVDVRHSKDHREKRQTIDQKVSGVSCEPSYVRGLIFKFDVLAITEIDRSYRDYLYRAE